MASLEELEDLVREKVEIERWTHAKLSSYCSISTPAAEALVCAP